MLPLRISIVTYNIWLTQRWDVRQPALGGFLKSFNPDLLCLQELQQTTRDFIDGALPSHRRVDDPYRGWTTESNIYWLSLIHISEPTRLLSISYAVFCLKKK